MTRSSPSDESRPASHPACGEQPSEYWTASGRGLILTGQRERIFAIAERLGLGPDAPVEVSGPVWALALWDEVTERYVREFRPGAAQE
ncbi:MAG TPA: hypothetical protein VKZ96_16965 [Thermomicrobiales bacterium]|nr:hypothetical protein [Thermomicrobiales bacterium]